MAILTPSQLVSASNATYFENTAGGITPENVRTLNDSWISSSILVSQTSSLSVLSASFATSALTASFVNVARTASFTPNAIVTGSVSANTLTFVKGNGEAFNLVVAQSGSVESASFAQTSATASLASIADSLDGYDSTSFVFTSSFDTFSGSISTRVTDLESWSASLDTNFATDAQLNAATGALQAGVTASIAGFATTASNTFTGINSFDIVSASFIHALSASVDYLSVIYQTSSIVYSSGSNTFGDAPEDVQTLWGTVDVLTGPLRITGSVFVTGSNVTLAQGSKLIAHDIQAANVAGIEIDNNTGNPVALFGAGGSTGVTVYGQVNATAFQGSGSGIVGVVSAQTASYVNPLNQDVTVSGSVTISPASVDTTAYSYAVNQISDATATKGNLIIARPSTLANSTGSVNVSGSNNIVLLALGATNANVTNGAAAVFRGQNSIVTVAPVVSGSNGTGYFREAPTFNNSVVNAIPTINDNRPSGTGTPLTLSAVALNSTLTFTTSTGSATLANSNIAGLSNNITISGTNGTSKSITSLNVLGNGNTVSIDSPSAAASYTGATIVGNTNTLLVTGSNTTLQASAVLGYGLTLTGSAVGTTNYGAIIAGRWNASDNTSLTKETAFAVGTGTAAASRRTSFHVSASGLTSINNNLRVTGSVYGNVVSASIASNTSSLDFSQGNFFTSLVESNTFFNVANPAAGQTVNLLLTTSGDATASFSSNVKQVSGSSYLPTAGNGKNDILTFISWDGTSVYLANVKNLI